MPQTVRFGCKNCGSPHLREKENKLFCASCGSVFEKNIETDEERDARILYLSRLDDAEKCLRISPPNFDEAEDLYNDFIKHYPDHSDGYWGLVRARYGIKYEKDASGKEIPSCYKSSYEDFTADQNFMKALMTAENEKLRLKYMSDAQLIAGVCKEWREEASKYHYDVFISFKATDDKTGKPTADTEEMKNLYIRLISKGYKVFFSPITMADFSGQYYDAYIFNALQNSKVMIVYGSKLEYFTATWVQNEWTRFLRMQARGEKKKGSCLVAYDGFSPNELPRLLRGIQAINASKNNRDFYTEVFNAIKKLLAEEVNPSKEAELMKQIEELKLKAEAEAKKKAEEEAKKKANEAFEIEDGVLTKYKGEGEIVQIPEGVTEISDTAFEHCDYVSHVIIPESVSAISSDAFNDCSSLTEIIVNRNNKHFSARDGHLYDKSGKTLLRYVLGKKEEKFIIPGGVSEIGENSFSHSMTLKNVEIPDSVTKIGYAAFFGCGLLTEIRISDGVTEIGDEAFTHCTELSQVILPKKLTEIGVISGDEKNRILLNLQQGVFSYCTKLKRIEIPEGVTRIGDWSFKGCTALTEVVIPEGLKSIGDGAFERCSALTEIRLPDSLEKISYNAFSGCTSLTNLYINDLSAWCQAELETLYSNPMYRGGNLYLDGELVTHLTIPEGVTAINGLTFAGCGSIESLTIPEGVEAIYGDAFYDCPKLAEVYLPASVSFIERDAFDCESLTTIYYPGTEEDWAEVEKNQPCFDEDSVTIEFNYQGEEIDETLNNLIDSALALDDDEIQKAISFLQGKIDLMKQINSSDEEYSPDEVLEMLTADEDSEEATRKAEEEDETALLMKACERDSEIENGVLKKYNGNATKAVIPNGVTSIGENAFDSCRSLAEVVISNSVTSIGDWAFRDCSSLTEIVIPNGVTSIGYGAFQICSSLTKVAIPSSVTSIGDLTFLSCSSLAKINVDENNKTYCSIDGVLYSKDKKTLIQYPEGKKDEKFVIPNSVTTIKNCAFIQCKLLTRLVIPNSVKSIQWMVFKGCRSLTEAVIPSSVTSIGSKAFASCDKVKIYLENPKNIKNWDKNWNKNSDDKISGKVYDKRTGKEILNIFGKYIV